MRSDDMVIFRNMQGHVLVGDDDPPSNLLRRQQITLQKQPFCSCVIKKNNKPTIALLFCDEHAVDFNCLGW